MTDTIKKKQLKTKNQNPLSSKSKRVAALKGLDIQELELLILDATEILEEKIKIEEEQAVENARQEEMVSKLLKQAASDGIDIKVLKKHLA